MLMLAFGVGTLPMLLAMGGFAEKLQRFTRHKWTRYVAGILLIAFGAMILSKALGGGHMGGHNHGMHGGMDHDEQTIQQEMPAQH
jgi:sulfite exporter TauE/SafE